MELQFNEVAALTLKNESISSCAILKYGVKVCTARDHINEDIRIELTKQPVKTAYPSL
jgi:hypothetical protein